MTEGPLGLASGEVRVVPYDQRWAQLYATEAIRLTESLLLRGLQLRLEHTGSTAVPGLAAKPIIDILAGRETETSRQFFIDAIQEAGYVYRGEQGIVGRDFFRKGEPRSYHIHLVSIGSEFWNEHRLFRDYLRAHRDAANEYQKLKTELVRRFPNDREAYTDAKTEFVREILRKAQ
ncbi:MAG: GrpB family protein [Gemmatimonadaceae bacterium]